MKPRVRTRRRIYYTTRCTYPRLWAKNIKKNTNSTQNKSQTHRAKQYEVTSFLSTDCELSTDTCSKNVYSLGPMMVCYTWFYFSSIDSICWVTVYKMVAITKPLRCEQILTRKRWCYIILCYNWLIGAVFAAALFHCDITLNLDTCMYQLQSTSYSMAIPSVGLVFACFVQVITTIYATVKIFRAIIRNHRQITSQENSICGESGACGNSL